MTLSYVERVSGQLSGSTYVLDKPPSAVSGDLMIAYIVEGSNGVITPPAGWEIKTNTSFSGPRQMHMAYKIAGGSEPSTYSFTNSATAAGCFSVLLYRSTGAVLSLAATGAETNSGSSVDIPIPGVTTSGANRIVVFAASASGLPNMIAPAGTTERIWTENTGSSNTLAVYDQAYPTAGATGTKTVGTSSVSVNWSAATFEIIDGLAERRVSVAITENADTLGASVTTAANLTLAKTEAPDTLASSASVALTLTLAKTEAPDTLSSTVSVGLNASLAVTESPDTISSSVSASVNLTAAITEAPDTIASSASVALNLTLAKTESADTLVSTASVSTNLSAALVESGDTLSSSASVALNLSFAVTESPDSLSASASVALNLSLAATESPDSLSAGISVSGLAERVLTFAVTESPDTIAASASVSVGAALSATEQGDTLTASVSVALNLSLSVTESPDTLNASAIVSAFATRILTLAITEAPDTLSAGAVGDVTIPFTSVHASITQRVPSVGVVRAGAQGRITQTGIRVAISQDP